MITAKEAAKLADETNKANRERAVKQLADKICEAIHKEAMCGEYSTHYAYFGLPSVFSDAVKIVEGLGFCTKTNCDLRKDENQVADLFANFTWKHGNV